MNSRGWGRVVWLAPLVALAGCQVLFGVDLPGEDAAGAGGGGSGFGGGQAGAAMCNLCGAFFDGAPTSAACVDNGPPSSFALTNALLNCLCRSDTCGQAACRATCETDAPPSQACRACGAAACEAEVNACSLDDGKGGAGGVGGSMGSGGGGTGGGPAECTSDDICIEKAKLASGGEVQGVFCVAGACTKPAGLCLVAERVVVDVSRRAPVVANKPFADACYFDSLDGALANPQAGMHVVVVADAAARDAPLNLDLNNVTLEGQASQAGQPVALSVTPADGLPLVRVAGDNVRLKGFTLDGANATPDVVEAGVKVEAGSATLEGPFRLQKLPLALSVEGEARATVVGTTTAPVAVTENARGVFVGGTAGLEMTGEGGESVVVEKTSNGAGVFLDKGAIDKGGLTMAGTLIRANRGSDGVIGTGGLEVREGRTAAIQNNVFVQNTLSVVFKGQSGSGPGVFGGVTLTGNDFSGALASKAAGAALCGTSLGANNTTLTLGADNSFPSGAQSTPGTCQALESAQAGNCTSGADIGFDTTANKFDLTCLL